MAGVRIVICSASLRDTLPSPKPNSGGRAAGGSLQALEALREQRGLPWLASCWLDIKLGIRLLVRHWGLTVVGGLGMTLAIRIAAAGFAAFDLLMWSPLSLDEGGPGRRHPGVGPRGRPAA